MRTLNGRLVRLAAVAAAIGVAWLAGAVQPRAEVDPLFIDRIKDRMAHGDVASAFVQLEDTIRSRDTSQEERRDLLGELARLRLAHGDFADAGEALALQAKLTARLEGARAPELASLFARAADAYARAGDLNTALDHMREALEIDRAYYDCAGRTIASDHARFAELLEKLGDRVRAAAERRMAEDAGERCRGSSPGSRGVVVTTELAAATPDSFARVKLFYATDRARTGSDRPDDFYGGDRGALEYGTLEVTVPRVHKPGEVESPSLVKFEWSENPERHFVLSRIETMTGDEMFADMRALLSERSADEAFVFIHGFNVTFSAAAKRAAQIAYDINFAGAPVLYSWPSQGSTFGYIRDEAVVRLSGRHLLAFLDDLVARSGARRINLVAHSMGNRALLDALELMAVRRAGEAKTEPVFEQVIFAAPDEDAALFSEMLKTVHPVARRLTLYGSDKDLALAASQRVHGDEPRAGQGGEAMLVSSAFDSIDMSVLGEDILHHGYFASTASALTDMLWLFWRDTPPDRRCGMDAEQAPRGLFWLFDPASCNGSVMLSALTMLKTEGAAALARLDRLIAESGRDAARVEDWKAIRSALVAAAAVP